jgi:hypothetical protein
MFRERCTLLVSAVRHAGGIVGRLLGTLLLAFTLPLHAQDKPEQFETAHFTLWSSNGSVPDKDFEAMLEGLYGAWKEKLGAAGEPRGRIKVSIYFEPADFEKRAGPGATNIVKGDTAHVLCDEQYFQGIGAAGVRLYLAAAYPKLATRKDAFPSLSAGLSAVFATAQWKEGKVEVGSLLRPDVQANISAFSSYAKSPDWWAFERAFKAEGKDFDGRQKMIGTQAWGLFQHVFGLAPAAGAVPDFLAALNDGKSMGDALGLMAKKANAASATALEKAVKDGFAKLKLKIPEADAADWLLGETAHYVLKVQKGTTNVKTQANDRQILADLKGKMELLYEKYSAAFKFKTPLPQKATVKLYKNLASYTEGGGPSGSAAYYDPATKELVGYEDSAENGMIFQTLAHEGCHQFFDLAFPGFYASETVPDWFSEGLAECFACSDVRGKELYVFTLGGAAPYHLETLKDLGGKGELTPMKTLLQLSSQDFMAKSDAHYAQAWGLVHFLWNAPTPDQGKGKYSEVVIRLIEGFKTGKARDDVYKDAFQVKGKALNVDDLEREWLAYLKTLKPKK